LVIQVGTVGNAAAVVEMFDASPLSFNGLVTDIRLGNGKSRWEVARYIRQSNSTIPVVYISGDSGKYCGAEGVPSSVTIAKPFAMVQIITALSTLLNQQLPAGPQPDPGTCRAPRRDLPDHRQEATGKTCAAIVGITDEGAEIMQE